MNSEIDELNRKLKKLSDDLNKNKSETKLLTNKKIAFMILLILLAILI
mgnify:CR=1 FL=1